MTNKRYFLLAGIFAFIGLVGVSCSIYSENNPIVTLAPAPVTQTPVATQPPTDIPSPTPTLLPVFGLPYSTPIPYPTASVVKSNAVAFIAENSLWIANVDGSGERKLVDIEKNDGRMNYFFSLQWSPDGKWISYISNDDLWLISPDGLNKRKILPASNNKRLAFYDWAPDSLQIAYTQVDMPNKPSYGLTATAKMLNWETEEEYTISSYKHYGNSLINWSPNGQYLIFNKDNSFIVFDVANRKVKKEISTDHTGCSAADSAAPNVEPKWSPNSEWFFYEISAAAHFTAIYMCVSKLDGSIQRVELDGTVNSRIVWDKTGDVLYFVVRKILTNGVSNLDSDQRLQRYDVRAQKLERILFLGDKYFSGWPLSISPNRRMLELHTSDLGSPYPFIFWDIQSLTTTKFSLDLVSPKSVSTEIESAWASDNENIILHFSRRFYSVDNQTGKVTVISSEHSVEIYQWVVSPIATTP